MAPGNQQASAVNPADVQATFCATVVDQFASLGLRHAVVAPGSRSTPMALALVGDDRLSVHVAHDERTAAFIALGLGLASGLPAALLCTSGTAATHFHAAVVEADLAGVPMMVLTADRPPELHGVGAPQTIDQQHLYGGAVRLFVDAGVPQVDDSGSWRDWASSWWLAATGVEPGPVHVNLPFREPLVGTVRELPPSRPLPADESGSVDDVLSPLTPAETLDAVDRARGVIVAGRGAGEPSAVQSLAQRLGWPVLADPRSGCRLLDEAVCAFDPILRHAPFAADHRPEVVVHLGEPPASKVLAQWLESSGAVHVQVLSQRRILDPQRMITHRVHAAPGDWIAMVLDEADRDGRTSIGATGTPWLARWRHAERAAQSALAAHLDAPASMLSEPAVARVLSGTQGNADAPVVQQLVVSSSMPVRDVEWFGGPSATAVLSNRGANGIDGVIATAIGAAAYSSVPTVVLVGDVAFCHDQSSLTALARRGVPLTIVVVDNDGGGIFSFLPQATTLAADRFEQLFGTPHGTDVVAVARAHGLSATDVSTVGELRAAVADAAVQVVRVRTDRRRNVADHDDLYRAVAAAIS